MGSSSLTSQSNHGATMVEPDSISSSQEEQEIVSLAGGEEEEEEEEEINSSVSFRDMSSLLQHLPFKRGLSRHYQGKSQSFTSLSSVKNIEDLPKPENPYSKKLKSCKSYGADLPLTSEEDDDNQSKYDRSYPPPALSHKSSSSASSCSSMLSANKSTGGRPPPPHPHGSSNTSAFSNGRATALFV